MNPSIRKYLLVNLLLGVTIIILLTAIVNYYLAQRDIENHLDILLSQSAYAIEALFNQNYDQGELVRIQNSVDQIPFQVQKNLERYDSHNTIVFRNAFEFEIWTDKGKLLLHSGGTPSFPIKELKRGFSNFKIDHVNWRVFTIHNKVNALLFVVAERFNTRHALGRQITNDYLITILFAYPLLGLLIWGIIGRGLGSLKRVAHEVSHREPNYLEPVDTQFVPTEIKPLVDELNQLFLRLHQALEREKRFASDAAHELRTPLAALRAQAQVALKAADDSARMTSLKNVLKGVDRCTHIVDQLLTLSRLVPEATSLTDVTRLNLPNLITEILANLAPIAIKKNIDIELIAPKKRIFIIGNATAIGILTRNLVDNAIRYTPQDGEIKVFVSREDGYAVVRVQDNGPGIPAELRGRVFERFFRVLGNKSPGSGLGLAIVQQIASLHQADIRLDEPENGEGLVIEVKFPLTK